MTTLLLRDRYMVMSPEQLLNQRTGEKKFNNSYPQPQRKKVDV